MLTINEYKNQVAFYGGMTFGVTDQSAFIQKFNSTLSTEVKTGNFLKSINDFFVNGSINSGLCYGLTQSIYLALKLHGNKEKALEEFANQLDSGDYKLAQRALDLHSFNSLNYSNIKGVNDFRKNLGLDFIDEERFDFLKSDSMEITSAENDKLIEFLFKQAEDDFITITGQPRIDTGIEYKSLPSSHILFFGKFLNTENKLAYIFYDSNAVPTLFYNKENLKKFLNYYFDNLFNFVFKITKANCMWVKVAIHSVNNVKEFKNLMQELQKLISLKINSINDQLGNEKMLIWLKHIKEKICKAEHGINYEIGRDFNIAYNKYNVCSNKKLLKDIKSDLDVLNCFDTQFVNLLNSIIEKRMRGESNDFLTHEKHSKSLHL